jgi:hypothetical protein
MNSKQENAFGMFSMVLLFFKDYETFFNPLAHFQPLITGLNDLSNLIIETDSKATADNTGYTKKKNKKRDKLEVITHKVAAALMGWTSFSGTVPLIEADDYLPSSLGSSRDSDIYVLARQLYTKANPVKTLLLPYNCTAADVDQLNTNAEDFLPEIQIARNAERESARARKKVAELFKQTMELLHKADDNMAVYQYTQHKMWTEYRLARKLVNNASGHSVHKKSGRILPGFVATAAFAEGIVTSESKMILTNSGKGGDLFFYFSSKAGERPQAGTVLTKVANGKSVKSIASAAGYSVHRPVLNILNPNVRHGAWKAEVGK